MPAVKEQIGGPASSRRTPHACRVEVRDDQGVSLGGGKIGSEAIVEIGPAEAVLPLHEVGQTLVDPAFLVASRRQANVGPRSLTEEDGVSVLMGQHRAEMRADLEVGIQIEHVATI